MKRISIPWPKHEDVMGVAAEIPVLVDWFPPLTQDQQFANTMAALDGREQPHPDPNLIMVRLER